MIKHTANYSHTNHNFVFQNLKENRISNEYLSAICIIKNILQRGTPTLMSDFLQQKFGKTQDEKDFEETWKLIDYEEPKWQQVIKGFEKKNQFPAKEFFESIPNLIPEYDYIQRLIVPEVEIKSITHSENSAFYNQKVDFYLPQAFLVIEIDGIQHKQEPQKSKDYTRASYLNANGWGVKNNQNILFFFVLFIIFAKNK